VIRIQRFWLNLVGVRDMEAARTPGVCSQLLHPCSLRGKGTQVGPPHCRWRHAENKCRAEPARYGKKDSTGVQFLATDLRGVWQWPDGYAILTTICKVKIDQSAGMAKLADAADLKSAGPKGLWGFDSPSRHQSDGERFQGPLILNSPTEGDPPPTSPRLAEPSP
jgi:hypothetical protein